MERLNNILGRATPRCPQSADQHSFAPVSRVPQPPSSAPTRRHLPEQMGRPGQRKPYVAQSQPASRPVSKPGVPRSSRPTRDLSRSVEQGEREGVGGQVSEIYATASYPDPGRADGGMPRSTSSYRSQTQRADLSRQGNDPGMNGEISPSRSFPARQNTSARPYYPPDRYVVNASPQPRADALRSYGDLAGGYGDEGEDEEPGIYYDDWEADDDVEQPQAPVYRRSERLESVEMPMRSASYMRDISLHSNEREALAPRGAFLNASGYESPPPPYLSERSAGGRPTRDLRSPSSVTSLSRPATRTQEVRYSQRVTQPLHPRIVSEPGREQSSVRPRPSVEHRFTPLPPPQAVEQASPARQAVVRRAVCPRCRGAGYVRENVPYGHPHFGKAIACECKEAERKEKRRQQLREISNLDAYSHQNFAAFDSRVPGVQEAYQAALEFAQDPPPGWLFLMGPNGCGKTHLAIAIAQQALDSGAVVLFEPVPDLLDHLRAAFAPTSEEVYDQLFSKMREAEVLILDDLGAQQSSPWANEKLFQLLNYRYNMAMPTVITANSRVLTNIEDRIRSRLSDAGLVVAVNMDRARDYRPRHTRRS